MCACSSTTDIVTTHPQCFIGSDFVKWLVAENIIGCTDREHATRVGQDLLDVSYQNFVCVVRLVWLCLRYMDLQVLAAGIASSKCASNAAVGYDSARHK